MAHGIVAPDILNTVVSGYLIEPPPSVDSDQCRGISDNIATIRAWAVQLLRCCLHSYYQNKPLSKVVWHSDSQNAPPPELILADAALVQTTRHWRIAQRDLRAKIDQGVLPGISMCLQHLHEQYTLDGAKCFMQEGTPTEQVYTTAEELHCGVLYNVLALLGHVNPNFGPTEPALAHMSTCFLQVPPQFEKEALVFVELLKLGMINAAPYDHSFDPMQKAPQPQHDKVVEITLISRVFSLLPMTNSSGAAWTAEFDHDLMCFNSIVNKFTRSLRSVFEMQLLHYIIKRRASVDPKHYIDISTFLPYKEDTGVTMGIVAKTFFEKCYVEKVPNTLDVLNEKFPACSNIIEDLHTAVRFWEVIMQVVKDINSVIGIPQALAEEFTAANTFLMSQKQHLLL